MDSRAEDPISDQSGWNKSPRWRIRVEDVESKSHQERQENVPVGSRQNGIKKIEQALAPRNVFDLGRHAENKLSGPARKIGGGSLLEIGFSDQFTENVIAIQF